MYLLAINGQDPTLGVSPPLRQQTSKTMDLAPLVFLDDGWSQTTSGHKNFGKFSLLHVQSAKAHAPCSDQTVVDPFHCDPMTIVAPPPELLISSDLEYLSVFKGFELCSSYKSDS
jgi:hypothetical protein